MLQTKKRKYTNIIIAFLMLIVSVIGVIVGSESVLATEQRTVKVAFFPMEGFHIKEGKDSYDGMDVKYLTALKEYVDWKIEYVECDSWEDALDKLSKQEVDLVGSAQYSEERAQIFDYADLSSGHTFGAIAINNDRDIAQEDFTVMKELTYGMVKGYVRQTEFLQYMKENGVENPKVVEYDHTEDLHKALEDGSIDALVHTFTEVKEGQKLIGRFAPKPFYYITYKGNDVLLQELNLAISDLQMNQPELEEELMNEFYYSRLGANTLLTTDEKEYLAEKKQFIVGYPAGYYPFSHDENGEFKGLSRKLLEEIFADTDVEFVYKCMNNQSAGKEALKNGTIDILAYYSEERVNFNAYGITSVSNYADIPLAVVVHKGKDINDVKNITTIMNMANKVDLALDEESVEIQILNSQQKCLTALAENKTDGVICSAYLAEYLLRTENEYSDLTVESVLQTDYQVTMLVREEDTELASILNKTLYVVDAKAVNEFMLQENEYPLLTLEQFVENHMEVIMLSMIIVMIIIIVVAGRLLRDGKRIQNLLYKDMKMDIWNLNYLMIEGGNRLNSEKKRRYAICYLNLAYFRRYNIIYGWNAGEKLLENVAGVLGHFVNSKEEICARNQGDRFVLFLTFIDEEKFMDRLNALKTRLEAKILRDTDNHIPVQMGLYFIPQDGSVDVQLAVSYANQAVDFVAAEKSSDIKVYDGALEQSIKEQHAREKMLESVDINKDFTVFYQPKVDIRTDKIVGGEALVRFMDPTDNGAIRAPFFFVPYFEQTGRITEVDMFVFESTCRMLRNRLDAGLPVVPISCNFSRMHFIKAGFADRFEAILHKYNISKDLIEVEITETLVIEELQQNMIKQTLEILRARNIRLSIDDFGAGYSSLGVFEQIPASVVKLDRSFLLNQVDRERQVKIMRGIVKLSDELEAEVVCEGVETEKDIELMKEIGAFVAQGYFYSRPVPVVEFEQKLNAQG